MEAADVPEVCAVDRHCFATPWSAESFLAELASAVGYYRVADVGGRIAGYIGSHLVEDEGHLVIFGVEPEFRRRGIGEQLLADVLGRAVAQGARRMTLEVRDSAEPAQALYAKYGFTPVSRRRRFYTDNDEDAIVMWIADLDDPEYRELLERRRQEREG
jgi:ribosomal-protein-alanine N-acetyltransferase